MKALKLYVLLYSLLFQSLAMAIQVELEEGFQAIDNLCPIASPISAPDNDNHSRLSLIELIHETEGQKLEGTSQFISPEGFDVDTRKDLTNKYFVAIGNGAQFIKKAIQKGAIGLIINKSELTEQARTLKTLARKAPVIVVDDAEVAIQNLARYWRQQLKAKIIGISGSNGKTTTKEFTAKILEPHFKTAKTNGNYNNHLGVPLTLLSMTRADQMGVIEMGMNNPGELEVLMDIAQPDIVVVNTVGMAHAGNFADEAAIAEEKASLYRYAPAKTTFIFNLDNSYTLDMFKRAQSANSKRKTLTYSQKRFNWSALSRLKSVDVSLNIQSMTLDHIQLRGQIAGVKGKVNVPVFGQHNLYNIMPSISIALAAGLEPQKIWQELSHLETPGGRNEVLRLGGGARVIFDGYNANPDSMKALINNVAKVDMEGHKFAVFGEMLELGPLSAEAHQELGRQAAAAGLQHVWFYAKEESKDLCQYFEKGFRSVKSSGDVTTHCNYNTKTAVQITTQIAKDIAQVLSYKDLLIFKGSRGLKVEQVFEALQNLSFEH